MPAYKIIGGDQKEYGPVNADEMRRWISEGRLRAQSLARTEGDTEWRPLSSFPEFHEALHAGAGEPSMAGGLEPPVGKEVWIAQTLARRPEVHIGRCLSRSFDLLSANFGLLFGASFIIWLIGAVCERIPLVGLGYWVLRGVFYGGLYLLFLKQLRGQPASVGDAFAGFGIAFAQLLLAGFISSVLGWIGLLFCVLPGIYLMVAWVFSVPLAADKRLEFWSAMELSRQVVTRVWFQVFALILLVFLPTILVSLYAGVKISISTVQAVLDALGSGLPDIPHLVRTVLALTKATLPVVLLTKFVFLLNLPFALGALMYAYEDLFGARTAPAT